MAPIHESHGTVPAGDAPVVGLFDLEFERAFRVAVLIPCSAKGGGSLTERHPFAALRVVLRHEHGSGIDGGVAQIRSNHVLQLADVLHADEQRTGGDTAIGAFQLYVGGWSIYDVRHALDCLDGAGHLLADVTSRGHDIDAVAGGERIVHGLLGAGGTGGDGGDERHADEQCGSGSGDATRILLDIGMGHLGGGTGQRYQRADAFHEYRQPEDGGKHESQKHKSGTGDGGKQDHDEPIAAEHIDIAGGLHLPYRERHKRDTNHNEQHAEDGARTTGATIIGQFERTQRLQRGHRRRGTCGTQGGEHGHDGAEYDRHHEHLPGEDQIHGLLHDAAGAHDSHKRTPEHHAQHGCDQAEQAGFKQHGGIQLPFLRADGA